jgi:hypothetical protein
VIHTSSAISTTGSSLSSKSNRASTADLGGSGSL